MTLATESEAMEALAAAINRASGLLNAVNDLYTASTDQFSGGNAFVAHAISTAQGLLGDAGKGLSDLYAAMDERAASDEADRQVLEEALVAAQSESTRLALQMSGDDANQVDQPALAAHATEGDVNLRENFAESYEELLSKLTAVEVFAADQTEDAKLPLLPLVQSLREQLQALNRVA